MKNINFWFKFEQDDNQILEIYDNLIKDIMQDRDSVTFAHKESIKIWFWKESDYENKSDFKPNRIKKMMFTINTDITGSEATVKNESMYQIIFVLDYAHPTKPKPSKNTWYPSSLDPELSENYKQLMDIYHSRANIIRHVYKCNLNKGKLGLISKHNSAALRRIINALKYIGPDKTLLVAQSGYFFRLLVAEEKDNEFIYYEIKYSINNTIEDIEHVFTKSNIDELNVINSCVQYNTRSEKWVLSDSSNFKRDYFPELIKDRINYVLYDKSEESKYKISDDGYYIFNNIRYLSYYNEPIDAKYNISRSRYPEDIYFNTDPRDKKNFEFNLYELFSEGKILDDQDTKILDRHRCAHLEIPSAQSLNEVIFYLNILDENAEKIKIPILIDIPSIDIVEGMDGTFKYALEDSRCMFQIETNEYKIRYSIEYHPVWGTEINRYEYKKNNKKE